MTMSTDEQLTPVAQRLVPALRQKRRIEGRSRALTAMVLAALAAVVAGVLYLLAHAQATDEVTNQLQNQGRTRDGQIAGIQDQLKGVCKKVANPSSLTPEERDGCYRAENSIPPAPAVTVTQPPSGQSGLTDSQVQAKIDVALSAVPRPLTVEQVAAVAQQVFATNAPALTPTPEKIGDAVSSFCAGDACRGPAGKNGTDGKDAPPVTDEQLRGQVNAFCAENNGCVGPPGIQGPQGISVVAFSDPQVDPADSTRCQIVVTLIDPDTTRTHTETFNVPAVFCLPG